MRKLLLALVVVGAVVGGTATGSLAAAAPRAHIIGAWPDVYESGTGGWILWSNGKVVSVGEAPFYGDARHDRINNVVGMLGSTEGGGGGYWLVTSTGRLLSFGPTCGAGGHLQGPRHVPTSGVVGLVMRSDGYAGFRMVTASGAMFQFGCY